MRTYARNSPEAVARVVAMAMIADGDLDQHELGALDQHRIPAAVGLARDDFIQIILEYCRDLLSTAQTERVRLFDPVRVNFILDQVDEPEKQMVACSAVLVMTKADGKLSAPEQALMRHILDRWQISIDQISDYVRSKSKGQGRR